MVDYKYNYSGFGVGVAVLDTGIYAGHLDLCSRIAVFRDFVSFRKDPYDDNGHGTHVAGIIGGDGAASGGKFTGIAPGCHFIALKVLDRFGNGRKEVLLQAFDWILANRELYNIRVVNISVGTTCRTACDKTSYNWGCRASVERKPCCRRCRRKSGSPSRKYYCARKQQKGNHRRLQRYAYRKKSRLRKRSYLRLCM